MDLYFKDSSGELKGPFPELLIQEWYRGLQGSNEFCLMKAGTTPTGSSEFMNLAEALENNGADSLFNRVSADHEASRGIGQLKEELESMRTELHDIKERVTDAAETKARLLKCEEKIEKLLGSPMAVAIKEGGATEEEAVQNGSAQRKRERDEPSVSSLQKIPRNALLQQQQMEQTRKLAQLTQYRRIARQQAQAISMGQQGVVQQQRGIDYRRLIARPHIPSPTAVEPPADAGLDGPIRFTNLRALTVSETVEMPHDLQCPPEVCEKANKKKMADIFFTADSLELHGPFSERLVLKWYREGWMKTYFRFYILNEGETPDEASESFTLGELMKANGFGSPFFRNETAVSSNKKELERRLASLGEELAHLREKAEMAAGLEARLGECERQMEILKLVAEENNMPTAGPCEEAEKNKETEEVKEDEDAIPQLVDPLLLSMAEVLEGADEEEEEKEPEPDAHSPPPSVVARAPNEQALSSRADEERTEPETMSERIDRVLRAFFDKPPGGHECTCAGNCRSRQNADPASV